MSDSPWFPFYCADFIAATGSLEPATVGVYIRLLAHQWSTGRVPIDDERALCRASGLFLDELAQYREFIESKFPNGINPRLQKERLTREVKRANGSKGGRPAGKKAKGNLNPKLNGTETKPKPKAKGNLNRNLNQKLNESETEPKPKASQLQSQSQDHHHHHDEILPDSTGLDSRILEVLSMFGIQTDITRLDTDTLRTFRDNAQLLDDEGTAAIRERADDWAAQEWITDITPRLIANKLSDIIHFNPTGSKSKGKGRGNRTDGKQVQKFSF